jgi:hypothetical protein
MTQKILPQMNSGYSQTENALQSFESRLEMIGMKELTHTLTF